MSKKKFKIQILISIFLFLISIFIYYNYREYNAYYESGENDTFNVNVGESFKIKLYENGSTGYLQCWLNENKTYFEREKNDHQLRFAYQKGCIGCGGIVIFNFKAMKKGIDTIKIANCPVGIERKKVSDYTDKNSKSENEFIVKITE